LTQILTLKFNKKKSIIREKGKNLGCENQKSVIAELYLEFRVLEMKSKLSGSD
jgi:hypothetical protein